MKIISDSGPIIHLREASALDLLGNCGDVFVPDTVLAETTDRKNRLPTWIHIRSLAARDRLRANIIMQSAGLHRGEADCIVLTKEMKATWFVTDDAAARYYAENVELEVHGSLGIVLYNAALGYIPESRAYSTLQTVRMGTLYISDYVYDRAVQMLEGITNN